MIQRITLKQKILICFLTYSILLPKLSRAAEKDLYDFLWLDPDKKVYVLQNKVHKKENTTYANFGVGSHLSSTFQDTTLLHINAGFNFTEELALDLIFSKYNNKDNEAFENLKKLNGSTPFIRKPTKNYGLIIKWSPFYGKINAFNKIIYFDWSLGAGFGKLESESNATTVAINNVADSFKSEKYNSAILKTEISIHASKNLHLNLGLLMNNFKAPGPQISNQNSKDTLRTNIDSILSIGISF